MNLNKILKENSPFLIAYLLFALAAMYFLFTYSKAEIHIGINNVHSPFMDMLFKFTTHLGEALVIVLAFIILLFVKYRDAILIAAAALLSTLITQSLKHLVFNDALRPKAFLADTYELYLVPGVDVHSHNSFPSGHTTAAFCLYFALSLITKKKWLSFFFFVVALSVGYSRMYLSQHFLIDVLVGSFIGICSASICYLYLYHSQKSWLNKSILKK